MKYIWLLFIFISNFGIAQIENQLAVDFVYALDTVPEKAYDTYLDTSFQTKIEVEKMIKMWGQIETMFGDFQHADLICSDTVDEYVQVFVTVNFKRKEQNLNISFNDSKKIVGFFMAQTIPCQPVIYPLPKYAKVKKYTEKSIQFKTDSLTLYGTLTLPLKLKSNQPIFIFVHGSGPSDRDETIGPNKLFLDLASGLASKGIPSLRYDKRTYLYKNPNQSNDIHKEVLQDVSSAIKWVKQQDNLTENPIYIIGHSMGAYLAPLIAQQNPQVKGIVMMAGNNRPLEELILEQYNYLADLNEGDAERMKTEIAKIETQIHYLKNNLTKDSPADKLPLGIPASYWLSLKAYHPNDVIQCLTIPILVLQGERDYQVTMKDYNLWANSMAGKSNYSSISYEKLNHIFTEGEGKPNPTEYMTQSNVPNYVLKDILKWVKTNI